MRCLFEYETPRVITIRHLPLGIFRLLLQVGVLVFVFVYQLWYSRGYQSFDTVQGSVTTKVSIVLNIILYVSLLCFVVLVFLYCGVPREKQQTVAGDEY